MPPKKKPLDNHEHNNNKKAKLASESNSSSFTVVDRGGNGDCIFRAVLDHFLPEANNQEIITLATGLRHLVVEEYRRLAVDRNAHAANINRETDVMEQQGIPATLVEQNRKEAVNQQLVAEGFVQRANILEQEGTHVEDDDMILIAHLLNINIIVTPSLDAYVNTADNNIEERNQIMPYYDHINIIDTVRIQAITGHYVALRQPQPQHLNQQQRQNLHEIFALIQNGMLERARLINENPNLAIRLSDEACFRHNYSEDRILQVVELINTTLEQIDLLSGLAAEFRQQEETLRQQQIPEDHRIAPELTLDDENAFNPVQFLPQEERLRQQQIAEDHRIATELARNTPPGICVIS